MNRLSKTMKSTIAATVMTVSLAATPVSFAGAESEYSGELKDAWIDGKIETAFVLNRHLNPFTIDTSVKNGVAYLEGTVESDIDRDLAGQIAKSVDGVVDVKNRLEVGTEKESEIEQASEDFLQAFDDATTTAVVKSKLLANGNTKGLQINVDTNNHVVTLRGKVESDQVRDLAEALAQNTDGVAGVENKLEIMNQ